MEGRARSYKDLMVWQKSHNLVMQVYKLSKNYPKEEVYGLTAQLRKASVSIPANIAEGFARSGLKDKLRFYNIASGSLNELSYYLFLSKELDYTKTDLTDEVEEIGKMLKGYMKALQN